MKQAEHGTEILVSHLMNFSELITFLMVAEKDFFFFTSDFVQCFANKII